MATKSMVTIICSLLIASVAAFDIVDILTSESENHSTFAKLLTDTKLADQINSQQTVTVLALDNTAVGAITSLDAKLQKELVSLHIILDYYDPVMLDSLKDKSIHFTTLFQASGQATGQMGFLKYTELSDQTQVFGSAVQGAPLDATLIGVVAARPYNVSIMAISKVIIPPGFIGAANVPSSTPSASNANSPKNPSSPPENAEKTPTGSTTPTSGNPTSPSSGNAATPAPKSETTPSGSTATATPTPNDSTNAPSGNDTSTPTEETSPSVSETTPSTSGDQKTQLEAPYSDSSTKAPETANSASNSSTPVPADASNSPATGGTTSDKTSSSGTLVARTGLVFVAMGLVLCGALYYAC